MPRGLPPRRQPTRGPQGQEGRGTGHVLHRGGSWPVWEAKGRGGSDSKEPRRGLGEKTWGRILRLQAAREGGSRARAGEGGGGDAGQRPRQQGGSELAG